MTLMMMKLIHTARHDTVLAGQVDSRRAVSIGCIKALCVSCITGGTAWLLVGVFVGVGLFLLLIVTVCCIAAAFIHQRHPILKYRLTQLSLSLSLSLSVSRVQISNLCYFFPVGPMCCIQWIILSANDGLIVPRSILTCYVCLSGLKTE